MRANQHLALASLTATVALLVTACGSAPSPTSGSTSGSGSTATSAPGSTTAPAPSGSPAPTADNSFAYEPGGVTYNGAGSAVEEFSIPAGTYSLNQQISYDPANDPDGSDMCLFGGELDYLPEGTSGVIPLGDNSVPITPQSPINGPPTTAPFPAGDYRLYIYPETTCSWEIQLAPDS